MPEAYRNRRHQGTAATCAVDTVDEVKGTSMRAVLQRVSEATVSVLVASSPDPDYTCRIGTGLLVLLGIGKTDTVDSAKLLVEKITHLRIFADAAGRMNLDLGQVGGSLLLVSQFTLYADTSRGRRPGFERAADPRTGRTLYELVATLLREAGHVVETGVFGAHMQVHLVNDGPVTIVLDTDIL